MESIETIRLGLKNFNASRNPDNPGVNWIGINIYVKNVDDEVLGGMLGAIWLQWLYIEILWVNELFRGQYIGAKIMQMAETEALNRGCTGIYLDTMSFQAKGFYEKPGYTIFGTLDDFPTGHQRYFFKKRIN